MAILGKGRTTICFDHFWLGSEENPTPAFLLHPSIHEHTGVVVAALDTNFSILVSLGRASVVGCRNLGDSAIEDWDSGAYDRSSAVRDAAKT